MTLQDLSSIRINIIKFRQHLLANYWQICTIYGPVHYDTVLQIEFVTENVKKEGSLASIYPEQMGKWKKIKSEFVATR